MNRILNRALSPLLAVLVLGSGVVAPALDRSAAAEPALEAEHHPSVCVRGHDHTICTQLGANQLTPAAGAETPEPRPTLGLPPEGSPGLETTRSALAHHPARAPPAA